jgi:hypothetical protein
MKRAQADEIAACAAQPHLRPDNLDDIGARPHLLDFILAESRHLQASVNSRKRSG